MITFDAAHRAVHYPQRALHFNGSSACISTISARWAASGSGSRRFKCSGTGCGWPRTTPVICRRWSVRPVTGIPSGSRADLSRGRRRLRPGQSRQRRRGGNFGAGDATERQSRCLGFRIHREEIIRDHDWNSPAMPRDGGGIRHPRKLCQRRQYRRLHQGRESHGGARSDLNQDNQPIRSKRPSSGPTVTACIRVCLRENQ